VLQAFLIDDEKAGLTELEYHLKKYPQIRIAGIFTEGTRALEAMEKTKPEILFLDINMPQLSGMDLAELVRKKDPGIEIVFVTAYEQYALEAFSVRAADYLLKPIEDTRFDETMEILLRRLDPGKKRTAPGKRLQISCFGHFFFRWEDGPPFKWRTEKTKELFAFLLHDRGRGRTKEELLHIIWPGEPPEKALRALYNAVYYLRKALEDYGISRDLVVIDNTYRMILGDVDCDLERFYQLENASGVEERETFIRLTEEKYFRGCEYPWAKSFQDWVVHLRRKVFMELAEDYRKNGDLISAEFTLRKAQE